MNTVQKILIAGAIAAGFTGAFADSLSFVASAEETQTETESAVQKVVTEYSDLWTGTITLQTGVPVQWYVHVPEDTEPKGCGATIKIPSLGWGTDTHNKEEGHLTLVQGDNLVYEFTPESAGDYLFTCWMGSGCHSNYLHVTDDGTYTAEKPADPTDLSAVWDGSKVVVSFTAPPAPTGAEITGYKVLATDPDGKRKKATGQESPITLEELDPAKTYTITVTTLATSGKSAGENSFVLEAIEEPNTEENTEATEPTTEIPTETTTETGTEAAQIVITDYADLWTGNITFKLGEPVKWYVNVPEGTEPKGCGATIKIPGLGWGTDTRNKEENHLTLVQGENLVYEFTPQETGDFLFTCWMGSACHYNYIHVTEDGIPDSNAVTGGRGTNLMAAPETTETTAEQTTAAATTTAVTTTVTTTTTAAATTAASIVSTATTNPATGNTGAGAALVLLLTSLGGAFLTFKRK